MTLNPGDTVICEDYDGSGIFHIGQEYVVSQKQDHEFLLYFDNPDGTPVIDAVSGNHAWWGANHFKRKDAFCPKCGAPESDSREEDLPQWDDGRTFIARQCMTCAHIWGEEIPEDE